jgi:electron transfer flavoprotein beta subunit
MTFPFIFTERQRVRIIVPIKQVPETSTVRMDEETGTMIREGVEAIVNPLDLYAIEAALALKEQYGGQVTAISMGPPKAISALREAVAMGLDDAVLLSDKRFAGSDTWATSYVLAAAIRQMGEYDLILCGERATDGDTGQVGPGIAAWLELPVVGFVGEIRDVTASHLLARRLVEDGHETLRVRLPALLTVIKEIATPRLPTLRGKQRARQMDIPTTTADQLDVREDYLGLSGSPTRVVKIFRPQVARECERLRVDDEPSLQQACDRVVQFLQDKELIG